MCVDIEVWLISPNLTLKQAAILLACCNPSDYLGNEALPEQYDTFLQILMNAIIGKSLPAMKMKYIFHEGDYKRVNVEDNENDFDVNITLISNSDLKGFLSKNRKIDTNFVFTSWDEEEKSVDCAINHEILNKHHPHYSSTLAIATRVWQELAAVETSEIKGKSVKAYIEEYLNNNKNKLEIVNNTQIKEIAKLINWEKGGGAPRQ